MAWHALPVLPSTPGDPRRRVRLPPHRLPRRCGPAESRRPAGQRRHAPQPGYRGRPRRPRHAPRRCGRGPNLSDFAEFAYEPRGGYGDGHQTAQAFSVAARRGGARDPAELPRRAGSRCAGDGPSASAWPTASASAPAGRRWPPAPGRCRWPHAIGIDLPIRAQRAQILLVDPGRAVGRVPVFSDLVSLQYVRPEGRTSILVGDSDHSDPEWSDPDDYRERAGDDELSRMIPKFEHRFPASPALACPRPTPAATTSRPTTTRSSRRPRSMGSGCAPASRGTATRSPRRWASSWPTSSRSGSSRHPDIDHRDFRWERFAERRPPGQPPSLCRRRADALIGSARPVGRARAYIEPPWPLAEARPARSPGRHAARRGARRQGRDRRPPKSGRAQPGDQGRRTKARRPRRERHEPPREPEPETADGTSGAAGPGHRQPCAQPAPGDRAQRGPAGRAHRHLQGDAVEDRERPDIAQPLHRSSASRRPSTCRSRRCSGAWPKSATPCS